MRILHLGARQQFGQAEHAKSLSRAEAATVVDNGIPLSVRDFVCRDLPVLTR